MLALLQDIVTDTQEPLGEDNPLRQVTGTVGVLYDPEDWETEDTDGDDPPWNNWVIMAQRIMAIPKEI